MQLFSYFRETREEMKHVTWPRVSKVIIFTILVVLFAVGMAYALGFVDNVFIRGLGEARTLVQPIGAPASSSATPTITGATPTIETTGGGKAVIKNLSGGNITAADGSKATVTASPTVKTVAPTSTTKTPTTTKFTAPAKKSVK